MENNNKNSISKKIIIPINDHVDIDFKNLICVKTGQKIYRNDILISSKETSIPALHAPISGIIEKIGFCLNLNKTGEFIKELCVVISPDDQNVSKKRKTKRTFHRYSSTELMKLIYKRGIKLKKYLFSHIEKNSCIQFTSINAVLINGLRCESHLTTEDYFIRNYPIDLIIAIKILYFIFSVRVIFIIEKKKVEEIKILNKFLERETYFILYIASKNYFSGEIEELIQIINKNFQLDSNYLIIKISTLLNIKRAVFDGKPITTHLISIVRNNRFSEISFIWVKIGTPIRYILFRYVKNLKLENTKIVINNLFSGFELTFIDIPITEEIDCLFIYDDRKIKKLVFLEYNCINCGDCIKVCPVGLLPQKLLFFVRNKNYEESKKNKLFKCTECGICSYICPSNINLVKHFRFQKMKIRILENRNKRIRLAEKFYKRKKFFNFLQIKSVSDISSLKKNNEVIKERKIFVKNAIKRVEKKRKRLKNFN